MASKRKSPRPKSENKPRTKKTQSATPKKRSASPLSNNEVEVLRRELKEALEQQTATAEVLRIIAASPKDLQPVLETLLANAVRLSGARQGHIRQVEGEFLPFVAHYNESPEAIAAFSPRPSSIRPHTWSGRAILNRIPIHILDAQTEPGDHPGVKRAGARHWNRHYRSHQHRAAASRPI